MSAESVPAARRNLSIGFFVALQLVMHFAAPTAFLWFRDSWMLGGRFANCLLITIGICSGQSSLSAIWLALGPGSALRRVPTVVLAWALSMMTVLGVSLYPLTTFSLTMYVLALGQLFLSSGLLYGVRRLSTWQINNSRDCWDVVPTPQFSLRMIFLWSGGCAVLFGATRVLHTTNAIPHALHFDIMLDLCETFAVSMVTCSFLVLPITWTATQRINIVPIVSLIFLVGIVAYFESLNPIAGLSLASFLDVDVLIWVNGAHALWLLANLLLLRLAGYHLERVPRTGP